MDFIDVRSDTVTQPTKRMRDAMANAPVGDDVFQDDPTVNLLEERFAQLVGKEASLFVPSGCMGNQICVMYHANKLPRGSEMIAAEECHVVQYENGSSALFSGVQVRCIQTGDGLLTKELVEKKIRKSKMVAEPETAFIVLENPTSVGTVQQIKDMKEIYELSRALQVTIHLDGARIFNAAAHLKVDVKEITQYCDTVMCCLSKGLGAPMGSMVAGSAEFVKQARKYRKLFGGGLRQVGIVAAAGLVALDEIVPQIPLDNNIALHLADELSKLPQIIVLKEKLQINMLFFTIPTLQQEKLKALQDFFHSKRIKILLPFSQNKPFRFLTHHYIREKEAEAIISAFKEFFILEGL